jgi:hypothetical protein
MSRLTPADYDEMLRLEFEARDRREAKKRICTKCGRAPALKDDILCNDCLVDHIADNEAYAEGET